MASRLVVSTHFLDPRFHGRTDGGKPEWPPSPLRVFQALVAAAGLRDRGPRLARDVPPAMRWLERLTDVAPPLIVAPRAMAARAAYRLSVPNNAMDVVARAWSLGNDSNSGDADPRTHRAMKTIQPTHMLNGASVHYGWSLTDNLRDEERGFIDTIVVLSRSMVALGWGLDLVVGNAAVLLGDAFANLEGEHWVPGPKTLAGWRVPTQGTVDGLDERYQGFVSRLDAGGTVFTSPPPLIAFNVVGYRRDTDPVQRPCAAFSLRNVETGNFRGFDPARYGLTVAGRMRHVAFQTATTQRRSEWTDAEIAGLTLGHVESPGQPHVPAGARRFAYLPIPSIEPRRGGERVGAIRRVLVTTFSESCGDEVAWAMRALAGQVLIDERTNQATAALDLIARPDLDTVLARYVRRSSTWATVTPIVLPGHDDRRHRRRLARHPPAENQRKILEQRSNRVDRLIRRAIVHAGFSESLAEHADIEWSKSGLLPGVELAEAYGVPDHLRGLPRYHVRIAWNDAIGCPVEVQGPVCLGSGRFMGLGLFASDE